MEKGGRVNWRKVPVKLFEADLGRNDVQVSNSIHQSCREEVGEEDRCTSSLSYEQENVLCWRTMFRRIYARVRTALQFLLDTE